MRDDTLESALDAVLKKQKSVESQLPYLRAFVDYAIDERDQKTIERALIALHLLFAHDDVRDLLTQLESLIVAVGQKKVRTAWDKLSGKFHPAWVKWAEHTLNNSE